MKTLCALLALFTLAAGVADAQQTATAAAPADMRSSPEQLDQLLGPIALYPDALIAIMLPATTSSAEIVLAARYLQAGHDPAQADAQPWDDSVRSLTHYPDTIRWMDENLAWTKQLGDAFLAQPNDVMSAIQRLRARALAAGTLFSNAQQQVIVEGDIIRIVPAQPEIIYAPYYNSEVIYVPRPAYSYYDAPWVSFGAGFSTGWWLGYNLDWGQRRIWVIDRQHRERYWRDHRDWHPGFAPLPGRPGYAGNPPWHTWQPSPNHPRPPHPTNLPARLRPEIAQPAPYSGAPRFYNPPSTPSSPRNDPRQRPPATDAPARDLANGRGRGGPAAPPATVTAPQTPPATQPTPTVISRGARPPAVVTPTPAPSPAPAASPSTPPVRNQEWRPEQAERSRPVRENRPPPSDTRASESRGHSSPPPATAPAQTAPPPASTTPAAPAAQPSTPPPKADAEDRRNREARE